MKHASQNLMFLARLFPERTFSALVGLVLGCLIPAAMVLAPVSATAQESTEDDETPRESDSSAKDTEDAGDKESNSEEDTATSKIPRADQQKKLGPDDKRVVPNLDGRDDPPPTAGEVLLWVPRVVLYPAYLVTEYVIRYPLGALVTHAEQNNWPRLVVDFFTFNDEGTVGVIPTVFWEFGFKPSFGLYFFFDDLFFDGNDFRIHGAFGGPELLMLNVKDRIRLVDQTTLLFQVEGETRDDYSFRGVGSEASEESIRYESETWEFLIRLSQGLWRSSRITLGVSYYHRDFKDGTCCDDLSIDQAILEGVLEGAPPGWESGGYGVIKERLEAIFDSREGRRTLASGFRAEAMVEHAFDPADPGELQWLNYGGGIGIYWDTGWFRTIGITGQVLFSDPLGDAPVPFTDLVELGGDHPMRNLRDGRLIGRSATVLGLEYLWPVWAQMDGKFEVNVGNVFDEHLSNFDPELLRWGINVGFASTGVDSRFEVLLGLGSEPFGNGGEIDQIRFFLGTHTGL